MGQSLPQPERRVQTFCLLIITAIVVAAALQVLRDVMIPFVLALFIAFAIKPLIDWLVRRLRTPRPLAVLIAIGFGLVLLGAIALVVSSSASQLADNAGMYEQRFTQLLDDLALRVPMDKLGLDANSLPKEKVVSAAQTLIVGTVGAVQAVISQGLLMLIFLMFLLIGMAKPAAATGELWNQAEYQIKRYVVAKFGLSVLTGAIVAVCLALLRIDLAIAFGFLTVMLNFIPNIGSLVAILLPLPIVLFSPDLSATAKILAFALPGATQFVIGNVIEPRILGQSLDLHPITTLLALIFWGFLWGIVGMFLAVPITAVIKIALNRYELTKPIANLMAGRFAPDPPPQSTVTHAP